MRPILLASVAMLMSAGAACAQTMSASPAPTGAPNAPVMTNPGTSPGNTAPAPMPMAAPQAGSDTGMTTATPLSASGSSGTTTTPAATAPAPMPSMAPPATTTAMTPPAHKPMMHHMMMPADASAGIYLHIAQTAMKHHDKTTADDALSHAETRLLTRAVPQGATIPVDDSPAISAIESARKALASGNMMQASTDTSTAMSQMHGGMGE